MKRLIAAFITLIVFAQAITAQGPKRELRSVWFTTVANIDWPSKKGTTTTIINQQKAELITYLDNFKKRNFNGICIQVRSMADAIYPSSYEPWSSVISGTRGTNPGWDPLAFAVEECHKRGLECWAWINPFRQRKTASNYTTTQDKDLANKGWLLGYNDYYVLNPGIPAARQRSIDVCKEIYTNYAVDGMLFDDYFYPNNIPESSAAGDWSLYQSYKASAGSSAMSIGDWRRDNANTFVHDLYNEIAKDRPDMRYGIGPAGVAYLGAYKYGFSKPNVSTTDWQYGTIYCDPWAWIAGGYVDFLAPQLYWSTTHSTAPYEPLCSWYSHGLAHFNRHFYASLGSYRITETSMYATQQAGWTDMAKMVQLARQYTENNAPGAIYYSAKYFDGPTCTGMGQYLQDNVYQQKALSPLVDWKSHASYSSPNNVDYKSGVLSWSAVAGARSNSIIRYTVYAVPESLSISQAMSADGDGIDVKYLLDVVYGTSFTIPTAKQSGYWYAVCVYDGYGYEYDPATYGYSKGESAKTTLTAPINGATPSWDAAFSWGKISGATYSLQIATDAAFSNVVKSITDITTNSTVIDLEGFTPGARLYWRVFTHEPNKVATPSNSSYFTVPQRLSAINPTLISPANGAEVEESVELRWNTISDAVGYRVVVAADAAFTNIRFTEAINDNSGSYTFPTSRIGKGTYYWRVESVVPHRLDGRSASRSFVIKTIDMGNFESGYTIHKDPASYPGIGDFKMENIWMRSVRSDFGNFNIPSNGTLNRGITISGDYIYMSGRVEASATSDVYLRKFSLLTGEHISDIFLQGGQAAYYPCNDVLTDTEGNMFIANLSLASSGTVYLHRVNPADGTTALIATIDCADRVDHVGVYGDITTSSFYVMAAGASSTNIYRWKIQNGAVAETRKCTAKEFYPWYATSFGIAPRIVPISETLAYIDGGSTAFTLYNVLTGAIITSFEDNEEIAPRHMSNNGGCVFTLQTIPYIAYAYDDHTSEDGHKFAIATGYSEQGYAGLSSLWTFPEQGLGKVNSTTCSAPIAARDMGDGSAIVVGYSVGNGLAAYRIGDKGSNGVKVTNDDTRAWVIKGRTVDFGKRQAVAKVYSLTGALICSAKDASEIHLPAPGTYLINTPEKSKVISVK